MRLTFVVVVLAAMTVGPATHALLWEGVEWTPQGGSLHVNSDGNLVVGPGAAAYYDITSSDTSWFEVTFLDNSGAWTPQVWVDRSGQELFRVGQFMSATTNDNYGVRWQDMDSIDFGWQRIAGRTPGEHTLKAGLRPDGTVSLWFDGGLCATRLLPDFGGVYLASNNGETVYTGYRTGADAPVATPEPASFVLLALSLVGLGGLFRKKVRT